MSIKDFVSEQKLGEGAFGVVERVRRLSDNQTYALKKVKYMDLKEKDKKNALNEIRILASIQHPNVVQYKEAFFEQNSKNLCTVMELAPNGDLASRIKQKIQTNQTFYEYEIWSIGNDIINGIAALHQRNILHRDIKPANIFFGEGNVAKIGDLNVSLLMKGNLAYTQTGTPYYASPQVWNNQPYGFQCDIWSFGCVLYEMCCLCKPFQAKNIDRLFQKVKKLKYEPLPYRFSQDLISVVQRCLSYRTNRISLNELKRIFSQYSAPKNIPQSMMNISPLMDTIKLPSYKLEYGEYLPKAKYENPQQQQQTSLKCIQQNESVLDRFMIPQKKLPARRTYLQIAKSQKNLSNIEIVNNIPKSPSFRDVIHLKSPKKSTVMDQILADQLNLRKRRLRLAVY